LRATLKIDLVLILLLSCLYCNLPAQDTVTVVPATTGKRQFNAVPLKATMLAVAFPGLGQVYNRKYWKIPLVYAGFGALAYSIGFYTTNYNDMMKAYQDFTDKVPETDSYTRFVRIDPEEYDPVLHPETYDPSTASWVEDGLLSAVDSYKKYRDLSYIGVAAWYLLSVLDANVDASLFNFDISKKLDLVLYPVCFPDAGNSLAGINFSLQYKF
jgi:hypothetical protein